MKFEEALRALEELRARDQRFRVQMNEIQAQMSVQMNEMQAQMSVQMNQMQAQMKDHATKLAAHEKRLTALERKQRFPVHVAHQVPANRR